jgi:hypothetical protein
MFAQSPWQPWSACSYDHHRGLCQSNRADRTHQSVRMRKRELVQQVLPRRVSFLFFPKIKYTLSTSALLALHKSNRLCTTAKRAQCPFTCQRHRHAAAAIMIVMVAIGAAAVPLPVTHRRGHHPCVQLVGRGQITSAGVYRGLMEVVVPVPPPPPPPPPPPWGFRCGINYTASTHTILARLLY